MSTNKFTVSLLLFSGLLYPIIRDWQPLRNIVASLRPTSTDVECERAHYTMRFISYDPLIMHVEDFITPRERKHLLEVGASLAKPSTVQADNGTRQLSITRTSSTAAIPRDDPIAHCVSARAAELQGFEELKNIEKLQVTAYTKSQEYQDHVDYFGPGASKNRVTTIFGILDADCENCGTRFPNLHTDWSEDDERWCRIVDCSSEVLVVNPLPGSALFWRNLHHNGSGDGRMVHSGMPLTNGHKTGLNIWTHQIFRE